MSPASCPERTACACAANARPSGKNGGGVHGEREREGMTNVTKTRLEWRGFGWNVAALTILVFWLVVLLGRPLYGEIFDVIWEIAPFSSLICVAVALGIAVLLSSDILRFVAHAVNKGSVKG